MSAAQPPAARPPAIRPTAAQPPAGPVIRPASPADLPALGEFFAGLSIRTRFLRFFAPVRPSEAMLTRLCGSGGDAEAVVASRDGTVIGHAIAVDTAGPPGGRVTDIGLVVADAWQHRGVGSALMRVLIAGARARGTAALRMELLPGNRQVLDMIISHWPAAGLDRGPDCLTAYVPFTGIGPEPSPAATVAGGNGPGRLPLLAAGSR